MTAAKVSKLSTTKQGSDIVRHAPDSESTKKCFDFPEAAEYFLVRLTDTLTSLKLLEQGDELLAHARAYVESVIKENNLRGDKWSADPACEHTSFQNLQKLLAKDARTLLLSNISEPMKMDYALAQDARFLRGYSVNGKPMDTALVDAGDQLFNAWLAEHNLISKGGQIYEITDDGEFVYQKDAKGNPIKDAEGNLMPVVADPDKVKQLYSDPIDGFQAYLANDKQSIKLTTQEHPFPADAPKVKPSVETPEVVAKVAPIKPTVAVEEAKGGATPDAAAGSTAEI